MDLTEYQGQGQIASLFAAFLPDIADSIPQIKVITADMAYGARLERFAALYPDRVINVGISEQNMIGVCAGLAEENYIPVAVAQATFITMRTFEPVRQYMSYMGYPIILIGLNAGLIMQFMGNTHYAVEDLAIMRSLPGLEILSPADAGEAVKAFEYALGSRRPTYIRLTGDATDSPVYKDDFNYSPYHANIVQEGIDITIFATGSMVSRSIAAGEILLRDYGLSVRIIDIHALSPFDTTIIDACSNYKLLVSVEEHYTNGGLGSAIADHLALRSNVPPLLKLGIQNHYSVVGDYPFLLGQHGLTEAGIAENIINRFQVL